MGVIITNIIGDNGYIMIKIVIFFRQIVMQ